MQFVLYNVERYFYEFRYQLFESDPRVCMICETLYSPRSLHVKSIQMQCQKFRILCQCFDFFALFLRYLCIYVFLLKLFEDIFLVQVDKIKALGATGVLADGRCLFRAIAHVACLRNGEEAPDEIRQRELADELRAQVIIFNLICFI